MAKRLVYAEDVLELIDRDRAYMSDVGRIHARNAVKEAPTVDAIPVAVMKRAIEGINAADQADQAGLYSYRLRDALRTVLGWYGCPAYKEHERRCK